MKKAIALFFCLQILSGNAFAGELMKLPAMIQHYFDHGREDHPDLTFTSFLWEHYMSDHSDEAKSHCDEKLPFKHCSDCCTHTVSISSFEVPDALTCFGSAFSGYAYSVMASINIPAGYNGCIWQPPRIG